MKKTILIWGVAFLMLCLLNACSQTKVNDLYFLIGKWKIENKNHYETWEKTGPNVLNGIVYKIDGGQKVILEKLVIKLVDNQIIYVATVFDQNDGRPIPFALNIKIKDWFVFENEEHDFPKKIMYQEQNIDELLIRVIGNNNKGFSYKLLRQIEDTEHNN